MSELGTSEVALNGRPRNWQTIAQRPELEMNWGWGWEDRMRNEGKVKMEFKTKLRMLKQKG